MTHLEILHDPNFKRSLENKIVAHINNELMQYCLLNYLMKNRFNLKRIR